MPNPPRRFLLALVVASGFIFILFITSFRNAPEDGRSRSFGHIADTAGTKGGGGGRKVASGQLTGHVIAPKLGNETAKAELGRAAWKLFHTMFARFPDKPTADESDALDSYIHLFQRLYPCGECAAHFGEILDKFPPQVSSRSAAAAWGCHVHNEVNKSLKKPLFDCSDMGDFYDCGCADDEEDKKDGKDKKHAAAETRERSSSGDSKGKKLPEPEKDGCGDSDKCEWNG